MPHFDLPLTNALKQQKINKTRLRTRAQKRYGAKQKKAGSGEFDPMGEDNIVAWTNFANKADALSGLRKWLARQED
jgi:hypothetical protein